jgi:predicted RND superfamily exporter protein
MGRTIVPCLVTELVLAAGFLTLVAVRMTAVIQFAILTAIAMPLAWLANALVLPLVLRWRVRSPPPSRPEPRPLALASATAGWMARQSIEHPRRIVAGAILVLAASALLAARVRIEYRVFDDLRPGSDVAREIARAEAAVGGLVPVAIHVETASPGGALDPAVIRVAERAAAFLRTFPEIHQANSLADFLRPIQEVVAGDEDEDGDGLPESPEGAAQLLAVLGDSRATLDVLSADHRSLAAVGRVLDVGVARTAEIMTSIEGWVTREQAALAASGATGVRLSATGQLRLFQDVNDQLLSGLAASFGGAILLSVLLMSVALRSWRLGILGLIPNASPVLLVLAFMGATGIPLSPVTVMAFSITLVIADDDTIQFLTRFRAHHAAAARAGGPEPHLVATRATVAEVGAPMLLSGVAVSAGFALLLASSFLGPARLGALIAATLAAAVVADLFLTPLLLVHLRPLRRRAKATP